MIPLHPSMAAVEEARRVAALHALGLLDSAPDREFDSVTTLAARLLGQPMAAITFVDSDRVWCKSIDGSNVGEEPRHASFCTWTIAHAQPTVIEDAALDRRLDGRAAHYGAHSLRFYAGAPLHAPSGERIGALSVASPEPGTLGDVQLHSLEELAVLVDALIAARATAREALEVATRLDAQAARLARQERALQQAQRIAMIGSWRLDIVDEALEWSDNVYRIHGLPVGEPITVAQATDFYPPHARAIVTEALERAISTGSTFDIETDFVTAQGAPRRVRSIGEIELEQGRARAIIGVFHDVTERHAIEQSLRTSAARDAMTGVANRAAFDRAIEEAVAAARRDGTTLMLALIDLDSFKAINDTLGHLAGDDVLREVGRRLRLPWLQGSMAARLGGDEFALIVDDPGLTADPEGFAGRLHDQLHLSARADGIQIAASGSVGVALLSDAVDNARALIHAADVALYKVKRGRVGGRRQTRRRTAADASRRVA